MSRWLLRESVGDYVHLISSVRCALLLHLIQSFFVEPGSSGLNVDELNPGPYGVATALRKYVDEFRPEIISIKIYFDTLPRSWLLVSVRLHFIPLASSAHVSRLSLTNSIQLQSASAIERIYQHDFCCVKHDPLIKIERGASYFTEQSMTLFRKQNRGIRAYTMLSNFFWIFGRCYESLGISMVNTVANDCGFRFEFPINAKPAHCILNSNE